MDTLGGGAVSYERGTPVGGFTVHWGCKVKGFQCARFHVRHPPWIPSKFFRTWAGGERVHENKARPQQLAIQYFTSSLSLSSLELRDTKVYEPYRQPRFGIAAYLCKVVVLKQYQNYQQLPSFHYFLEANRFGNHYTGVPLRTAIGSLA